MNASLAIGWLVLTASYLAAEPGVIVDASTRVSLSGEDEIRSSLFGITAFEGFPSVIADRDYRARLAAIRPGCIRLAGNVAWCAPAEYDPAWYDTPDAMREFTEVLLFGARYPTGRFLPVVRELGAEPMCSLGGPPPYLTQEGTGNPSDFDRWAELCAGYVGLWKRADPALRLVQVWNEPNASWYLDPRVVGGGTSAAELHIEMANKVAAAIKARFPDVLVGGPVLCWPPSWPPSQEGQQPWYTWQSWTVPWLEGTRDSIDFFDFHDYSAEPDELAVQLEMTANQSLLGQGRRLPIAITESNRGLAPEELDDASAVLRERILPYERWLLRGLLPQADKVLCNLYHDLHASAYTLLPGPADRPDSAYWLLWVLRDLRGTRVVADSGIEGVVSLATVEEDRLTLVMFNDTPREQEIPLSVTMPCGWWTGPRVQAVGLGPGGGCERIDVAVRLEQTPNTATGAVTLPPYATVALSFDMDRFVRPGNTRRTDEHFGDRTLQLLSADTPATVTIRCPAPQAGSSFRLRLGLLGPEGTEPLAATLNGTPVDIAVAPLQEIALAEGGVRDSNVVTIELREADDNPRLALAFASIVEEQE